VEFGTKKKEDQIRLNKINLHQTNLVKNPSFCVFLALVVAGLLFRQNRIKQKSSRKGFDYKPDDSGRSSFGMGLMEGLTREIRGTFSLDGTMGTTITVSFEMDLLDRAG
jgi:two-component sensor histidine kinase